MAAWFVMVKSSFRLWCALEEGRRQLLSAVEVVRVPDGNEDLEQPVDVEQFLRGPDGDEDQVVDVDPKADPLLLHDSHHAEEGAGDLHRLAQGVCVPEELALHGPPENADAPPGIHVRLAEERPDLDVKIPDVLEGGSYAEDGDVARPVQVPHLRRAEDYRRDPSEQVSLLFQDPGIVQGELVAHRADDRRPTLRLDLSRSDDQDVAPEPGELFLDVVLRSLAQRHEKDDRRDADDHTEHREGGSQPVDPKGIERHLDEVDPRHPRISRNRSTDTSFPSTMWTVRCARRAIAGSWVTTTTVTPDAFSLARISISSSPDRVSRFPVGSSASRREGLLTRARAMATRCFCPPESSLVRWSFPLLEPHRAQFLQGAPGALLAGHAGVDERQFHVSKRRVAGEQVEHLEDEADLPVAQFRQLVGGESRDGRSLDLVRP